MTFANNCRANASGLTARARSARTVPCACAFTLIELLVVIGIIVLLIGILLPAVNAAWRRAVRVRTQADLSAIAAGLDAYRSDYGSYPPATITVRDTSGTIVAQTGLNCGAAALCKALLGPYDAAHYYTSGSGTGGNTLSNLVPSTNLQNPPQAYSGSTTYQAGDVVLSGAAPTYDLFANTNNAGGPATVFICVRNDTTNHQPVGDYTDFYWSRFFPYDGADGVGTRQRLGAVLDGDAPHAAAGKVIGPYLSADQFRTSGNVGVGMALLDRYGSPILYFPVNRAATVTASDGLIKLDPSAAEASNPPVLHAVSGSDNFGPFVHDGGSETVATAVARVCVILGDYNIDGRTGTDETPLPPVPFLLWTAGPDRIFGPRGAVTTDASSWRRGDVVLAGAGVDQNRRTADDVDDVTNFRD